MDVYIYIYMHIKQFCKYLNESDLNISCIKNPHYRQYSTHRLFCKIYISLVPFKSSAEANDI